MPALLQITQFVAVAGALTLASCGDDKPASNSAPAGSQAAPAAAAAPVAAKANGKWVLDEDEALKAAMERLKAKHAGPMTPEEMKAATEQARKDVPVGLSVELKDDGTLEMDIGGMKQTGRWTQIGAAVTFIPADNPKDTMVMKLDGQHLRPDVKPDSHDAAFILKRQ